MMRRSPRVSEDGLNKGAWTAAEDKILITYVSTHGEGKWSNVARVTDLKRCGKSCRLRWLNYLRPDIKRGNISEDEEQLIIRLHKLLGNRWSLIAGRLPGRTDNEIKNYWNTYLSKKPKLHKPILNHKAASGNSTTAAAAQQQIRVQDPENAIKSVETRLKSQDENNPFDFLMDFNVDDFCQILDSDFTVVDANNVNIGIANGSGSGSGFMSLDSFLDSDVQWPEMT